MKYYQFIVFAYFLFLTSQVMGQTGTVGIPDSIAPVSSSSGETLPDPSVPTGEAGQVVQDALWIVANDWTMQWRYWGYVAQDMEQNPWYRWLSDNYWIPELYIPKRSWVNDAFGIRWYKINELGKDVALLSSKVGLLASKTLPSNSNSYLELGGLEMTEIYLESINAIPERNEIRIIYKGGIRFSAINPTPINSYLVTDGSGIYFKIEVVIKGIRRGIGPHDNNGAPLPNIWLPGNVIQHSCRIILDELTFPFERWSVNKGSSANAALPTSLIEFESALAKGSRIQDRAIGSNAMGWASDFSLPFVGSYFGGEDESGFESYFETIEQQLPSSNGGFDLRFWALIPEQETPVTASRSGLAPEIDIQQPGGTLLSNDSGQSDFGFVGTGSVSNTFYYTIINNGTTDLNDIALSLSGANPGDFVLAAPSAISIAPGKTSVFTVTFKPLAAGVRLAVVNVASNDADENPFGIVVKGTGNGFGSMLKFDDYAAYILNGRRSVRLSADIVNRGDVTSNGFRLRLCATKSRYNGGTLEGFVLATSDLFGGLPADINSKFEIFENYGYNAPRRGSYYLTLVVEENSDNGFEIANYVNFPKKLKVAGAAKPTKWIKPKEWIQVARSTE